jgi:ankyrin repeat protein
MTTSDQVSTAAVLQLAQELFDHARAGRTAALVEYVEAGIPVNLRDEAGNTLLMLAAYYGHAETVAALARLGADVDRLNDQGQSPLAGAVFKRWAAVVDVLVDAGASARAGTPSALNTALAFGLEDLAARLGRI